MLNCPGVLRSVVCYLTAFAFATTGCASRTPLPAEATRIGNVPETGLAALSRTVPDPQGIGLVGFYFSDEERMAFEQVRDTRVEGRKRPINMSGASCFSGGGGGGGLAAVVLFFVVIPVCLLVILPAAMITASAIEHNKASAKEPSLPSDRELDRLVGKIQEHIEAKALIERTLLSLKANRLEDSDAGHPLLLIRPESATFKFSHAGGSILINVVAHAQPSAGTEWPVTQHQYSIRYTGSGELERDLALAQEAFAQSIAETYLPARSAVAVAKALPRPGERFTYRVVDHSKLLSRAFTITASTKAGPQGVEEEVTSLESEGREWLKTNGRDVMTLGASRFETPLPFDRLICLPGRTCSASLKMSSERIKVPSGVFDATVNTIKQAWPSGYGFNSSRTLKTWRSSGNRLLRMSASDSLFGESTTGKYDLELLSYEPAEAN